MAAASTGSLQLSRQRYLEQLCVVQQVQELAQEVQALLLNHTEQGSELQQVLTEAGHPAPVAAYRSLSQHLAAAQAMQRLHLPSSQPAKDTDAAESDTAPVQDGSRHHLLGLTPQALKERHMPSRKAAQAAHAPILPELEARLVQQAQQLVEDLAGEEAADPQAHAHVLQQVKDKVAQVAASEAEVLDLVRDCSTQAQQQMWLLQQMQQVLAQLVEECMLKRQHHIDQVHFLRLAGHVKVLFSKLKVLEARLQESTYTKDTLPALRKVAGLLQQEEEALEQQLDQVQTQLRAYEECGDEFAQVVWDYAQVKEELRMTEFALQRFMQLEEEVGQPAAGTSGH